MVLNMKIKTTVVYEHLHNSNKRITVMQGGTRCIVGETLVLTDSGYIPIKDVKVGMMVLSFDDKNFNMVFNPVVDKFIYKYDHTNTKHKIHEIKLKNETIKCTIGHKFCTEGQWLGSDELARRIMERDQRDIRQISDKQQRKNKNNELEMHRKDKINASRDDSRLYEHNNNNERKTKICNCSQVGCKCVHTESTEQTRSESYKSQTFRQQCGKSGMGYSPREHTALCKCRKTNIQQRGKERDEQINRDSSERDKKEIQTESLHKKSSSERVWSISSNNKRCSLSLLEAREININEIISIKEIESTETLYDLQVESTKSYVITKENLIVHNSGKTYNILKWFIVKLSGENNKILTICRQTMPSIKATVMRDFLEIMNEMGIFDPTCWSVSNSIYKLGTNTIEFRNLDDDQKVRGSKRDYLFINEANEVPKSIWKQLIFRTTGKIVLDYNPSDEFHWIYDEVIPRDDCDFYKTTFKDNPFLPIELINEIKRLKDLDPNYWRVYGLGERGISEATIFRNWEQTDKEITEGEIYYGLDFGFNHPTALVKIVIFDGGVYARQLIYDKQLTTPDIIKRLEQLGITGNDSIYADCSRPETIQEIHQAGYNIYPTKKGEGSVAAGIDHIKRHRLFVDKNSLDLIKELKTYKWKVDKNEKILDEPVKVNDDAVDALRYAFNSKILPSGSFGFLSDPENIMGLG